MLSHLLTTYSRKAFFFFFTGGCPVVNLRGRSGNQLGKELHLAQRSTCKCLKVLQVYIISTLTLDAVVGRCYSPWDVNSAVVPKVSHASREAES